MNHIPGLENISAMQIIWFWLVVLGVLIICMSCSAVVVVGCCCCCCCCWWWWCWWWWWLVVVVVLVSAEQNLMVYARICMVPGARFLSMSTSLADADLQCKNISWCACVCFCLCVGCVIGWIRFANLQLANAFHDVRCPVMLCFVFNQWFGRAAVLLVMLYESPRR